MATSPTTLTVKNLRERGYLVANVEKYNHHIKRRIDLFGFIDVIGVGPQGTIAVQSTGDAHSGWSNFNKRIQKIADHENVDMVREAGWIIEVHGWKKVKNRWTVKIVDVS